jgi:3-phosphoshikimate 1-carboxyvinyltransferase
VEVTRIKQLREPPDVSMRPPGSKSITNRALLCASLAEGTSTLRGALFAQDTQAMMDAVAALGCGLNTDRASGTVQVHGAGRRRPAEPVRIDARQSGTTSRFILPAAALGTARVIVDGAPQLRSRPFGPLLGALEQLGVSVQALERPGCLPIAVRGPALGGDVRVEGHISSQFVSGLLMAAPLMDRGLRVELSVMEAFGVGSDGLAVAPGRYVATDLAIEPDASAAAYFFAAAAISGGRVTVEGLGAGSIQGDVAFVDILERMGALVERGPDRITVRGTGTLHGVHVDMADISDTAQTLAAVAVFADTPTTVAGIGFIRGKESDRIGALATELRRAGIEVATAEDGFTVTPGTVRPTRFRTYDDHRMAMSLALLGLRAPGVEVEDPGCVAKTYPDFFADLASLH